MLEIFMLKHFFFENSVLKNYNFPEVGKSYIIFTTILCPDQRESKLFWVKRNRKTTVAAWNIMQPYPFAGQEVVNKKYYKTRQCVVKLGKTG